ncbi:hypothetical protein DSO57_1035616 [Entomophthora muscae]|uniref:Uncharacterized protein n=1 Tax=Entomophthora muscae TaxID=34485 RepID=A0ACC2RQE0_9FUNG|nr:hypothetical protein DSO57_1035616 [Entomophthora muscae]
MLSTRGLLSLTKKITSINSKYGCHLNCNTAFKDRNTKITCIKLPSLYCHQIIPFLSIVKRKYSSISIPSGTGNNPSKPSDGRLAIRFTCKVCNHINTKTMSKLAYEKGVVLIQCDGCENRHLIADNLGWFRDSRVNIEDLAHEKGEKIKRFNSDDPLLKGLFEFDPKSSE